MKEFLQGRRLGFAPRSLLGNVALGVGVAALLLDLMTWFGWGTDVSNPLVIGAYWLVIATAAVGAIAALASLAEYLDVPDEDRGFAQLDLLATLAAVALYAVSAALRSGDLGAAAAAPLPFLVGIAGLIVLLVDAVLAGNLYSAREWQEIEEEPTRQRHPRRRAVSR